MFTMTFSERGIHVFGHGPSTRFPNGLTGRIVIDHFVPFSGPWREYVEPYPRIQEAVNNCLIHVDWVFPRTYDVGDFETRISAELAVELVACRELQIYFQGLPDALAAITDQRNPNHKYGLAPFLYGLRLVVEPETADVPLMVGA